MQPGSALDRLVAEKVMGWRIGHYGGNAVWVNPRAASGLRDPMWADYSIDYQCPNGTITPYSPSTNIAHAWAVVRHMSAFESNAVWFNCTAGAFICIDIGDERPKSLAQIMFDCPDKMPLAICLAALEACAITPPNPEPSGGTAVRSGDVLGDSPTENKETT